MAKGVDGDRSRSPRAREKAGLQVTKLTATLGARVDGVAVKDLASVFDLRALIPMIEAWTPTGELLLTVFDSIVTNDHDTFCRVVLCFSLEDRAWLPYARSSTFYDPGVSPAS